MSHHKQYLIDVRTPAEFSTGFLPGAINVEYQDISKYVVDQESLLKDSPITLYCRSGRRTAIAKAELEGLGYINVRDLGSLEMAKEVLEQEAKARRTLGSTPVGVEWKQRRTEINVVHEGIKA